MWHLATPCIVLATTVLGIAFALALSEGEAERQESRKQAFISAKDAASAVDRLLAGLLATTEVLSLSYHLQTDDIDGFDGQARSIYGVLGSNVVLRDRGGRQVVNTRMPHGTAPPEDVDVDPGWMSMESERPLVSDLVTDFATDKPLLVVSVPVLRGEEIVYHLCLEVEPRRIHEILMETVQPPKGWSVLVSDSEGRVVASNRAEIPGQIPKAILAASRERSAVFGDEPADGRPHAWFASIRSKLSGWSTVVVAPESWQWPYPSRFVLGLASAGAAILALSLGQAFAVGRRVRIPVTELGVQAARLGEGRSVERLSTPVREINMLSAALVEASEKRSSVEAALRSSEERLQLAQSAGRIGTWDWDARQAYATCSESYCKLYGLDAAEPRHCNAEAWLAHVHPDDRSKALKARAVGAASGRIESEYRIVRADGAERWIVERARVFCDPSGQVTRVVGANVDVTDTHAAAEKVRQLQFELMHASRLSAMGQMAASLAHELNQPLTAATAFMSAARSALASAEPDARLRAETRIGRAAEQVMRAGSIIRRLRDFIQRGETEKAICRARDLIEEAVALALVDLKDPGLRLRYELDPLQPYVLVDRVQIQQVLFNLVRNAIEAMAESARREITLSTRQVAGEQVEFAVADTGPGLPPDANMLFKPFATSKRSGMGLGLSICWSIVEAHHGRLWADTNPDGGSTFHFVVPAVEPSEKTDHEP